MALHRLLIPLLANLESTLEIVAEESQIVPKHVRIVAGARMMLEEIGESLNHFRKQHPDVKLRLMTADNRAAQGFVLDGKADMALMIEPPLDIMAQGITCERLYPIDYLAAFPARHRLIRKPDLTLHDLVDEPLIVGNPDTTGRRMLEQACFRLGIQSTDADRCGNG